MDLGNRMRRIASRDTTWASLLGSIVIVTVVGFVLEELRVSEQVSGVIAFVSGLSVFLCLNLFAEPGAATYHLRWILAKASLKWAAIAIPVAVSIVVLLSTFLPSVQAAIVVKSVSSIENKPIDALLRSTKTAVVLQDARRTGVKVQAKFLDTLLEESRASDAPSGWAIFLSALNYKQAASYNVRQSSDKQPLLELGHNFNLVDSSLVGQRIRYDGGPLKLERVEFRGCTFDVADNANGRAFLEAVLKAGSGSVNLTLR